MCRLPSWNATWLSPRSDHSPHPTPGRVVAGASDLGRGGGGGWPFLRKGAQVWSPWLRICAGQTQTGGRIAACLVLNKISDPKICRQSTRNPGHGGHGELSSPAHASTTGGHRRVACMPRGVYGLDFCESWLKIPLVPWGSIPESSRSVQVQEQVAHIVPIFNPAYHPGN